jgi:hypothetical protein
MIIKASTNTNVVVGCCLQLQRVLSPLEDAGLLLPTKTLLKRFESNI